MHFGQYLLMLNTIAYLQMTNLRVYHNKQLCFQIKRVKDDTNRGVLFLYPSRFHKCNLFDLLIYDSSFPLD
jgi:hypothetical protein